MSDFLGELKSKISVCGNYEDLIGDGENLTCTNQRLIDDALALINSLGKNACRMLEIGRLQDELVKLGYKHHNKYLSCLILEGKFHMMVDFDIDAVVLPQYNLRFNYSSPTWQQDVLTKVKELINDK